MDYINVIGTIFDNSTEHTAALASQVKDLRLNKKQQDINQEVERDIQNLEQMYSNIPEIQEDLHNAFIGSTTIRTAVVISQNDYDSLITKNPNTEYNII